MTQSKHHTAVVGFCARSGTGKTTLLKRLIPAQTTKATKATKPAKP